MKHEDRLDDGKGGRHRGGGHKHKSHHHRGAQTFRRGRALEFLERLNVKRETLKAQLNAPELQSIDQVIVGELKAIETVMNEFIQLFELHESEEIFTSKEKGLFEKEAHSTSDPDEQSEKASE